MFKHSGGCIWVKASHEIQYQQQVGWDKTTADGLVKFSHTY